MKIRCIHQKVKCLECGKEGSPSQLLASRPRGPRSPEAAEQSRKAASKGGWPKGKPRKPKGEET